MAIIIIHNLIEGMIIFFLSISLIVKILSLKWEIMNSNLGHTYNDALINQLRLQGQIIKMKSLSFYLIKMESLSFSFKQTKFLDWSNFKVIYLPCG